jgi:hypothetical protein
MSETGVRRGVGDVLQTRLTVARELWDLLHHIAARDGVFVRQLAIEILSEGAKARLAQDAPPPGPPLEIKQARKTKWPRHPDCERCKRRNEHYRDHKRRLRP